MKDQAIRNSFCDSCCLQWIKPEPHNEKLLQKIRKEQESENNQQEYPILQVSSSQSGIKTVLSEVKIQDDKKNYKICLICDKEILRRSSFGQFDESFCFFCKHASLSMFWYQSLRHYYPENMRL